MEITEILPSSVSIKHDYIKIDGVYMSIVTVVNYAINIEMLKTMETLIGDNEIEISFHIKRQNNFEILKKLTNIIAQSGAELSSVSKNQIDVNVLDNVKSKAAELKKKIQIDNEQIYMLSTYMVIKANSISELMVKQKKYINTLYAKQIVVKPTNFRQKEAYIATLPIILNSPIISKYTCSMFTERGIAKLFPFLDNDILNKKGILLGKANNNLCAIDMFCDKNNNYNMCIFGSSGAGKSYFVKLVIIKNAYKGIRQIIIDPEGEYVDLVRSLGGHVYTSENYNPFEINESFLENKDFFNQKIEQIVDYISQKIKIVDKEKIKECCKKTYSRFGICEVKESLYKKGDNNKLYIKPKYREDFPTINDLINEMQKEGIKNTKVLEQICKGNAVKSNTELFCFTLNGKSIQDIGKEMKNIMPKIYELIKSETLIYFDEVWKCIGFGQDRYVIENIYNMFKTLRKKKAGIIAITQDICDLFNLDEGNFGKSILNNANVKALFKMEWQDVETLNKMVKFSDLESNIKSLSRGNAYINMGNTNFRLEVKATEFEHKLIEGERYEENINSNE